MFAAYGLDGFLNRDRFEVVLREAIRSALETGWDPASRGAAHRHTPESA